MRDSVVPLRMFRGVGVEILDQTKLPGTEARLMLTSVEEVCEAIRSLRVRGAPLLGIAGAAGMAVAAQAGGGDRSLELAAAALRGTRPTAVDLGAAVERALRGALAIPEVSERAGFLWRNAEEMLARQDADDRAIGRHGAALLPPGAAVLTHCNAGALATGGYGTALGVVRSAYESGLLSHCYATETRPLLQGARLTMWELIRAGIPATLLPDTAAASLIASGRVQAIVTGADRIAANGDTANKVGTYGLAAVAARHGVPFYIAAPRTTIDLATADGAGIPIEFRSGDEVGGFDGQRWTPAGAGAYNPAFDVTPAELVSAIITECGVVWPPFGDGLRTLMAG
ncbi:MAG: S-methyl-5-thioribose-1-phosphate isomerase [Dehalococcoidia bacterium]